MNNRERFNRILSFEPVDHGFNYELGLWGQVLDRWHDEGMPQDVNLGSLIGGSEFFGLDRVGYLPLRVAELMPAFEEEVIEEDERYLVKRYSEEHDIPMEDVAAALASQAQAGEEFLTALDRGSGGPEGGRQWCHRLRRRRPVADGFYCLGQRCAPSNRC
mgnify:CR=1 FL=1